MVEAKITKTKVTGDFATSAKQSDGTQKTQIVDSAGMTSLGSNYTIKIEYDVNNNLIYIGNAVPGSLASTSIWRIKKLTYDTNNNITDIQWADGNTNYDNIWNDRATYTYS